MKKKLDRALTREDVCPRCLGELDTGWECNDCGYDASPVFTNCNVCGIKLRTKDEHDMGMCERCAAE